MQFVVKNRIYVITKIFFQILGKNSQITSEKTNCFKIIEINHWSIVFDSDYQRHDYLENGAHKRSLQCPFKVCKDPQVT